jgi:cell division septation protein DedD
MMKEKIFLKKTPQGGKGPSLPSPFVRFGTLFKLGIALLVWIAIIPLLWHRNTKTTDDKGTAGKNVVVKGIPKAPATAPNVDLNSQPRDVLPSSPPGTEKPPGTQEAERKEATSPGGAGLNPAAEPAPGAAPVTAKPVIPEGLAKKEMTPGAPFVGGPIPSDNPPPMATAGEQAAGPGKQLATTKPKVPGTEVKPGATAVPTPQGMKPEQAQAAGHTQSKVQPPKPPGTLPDNRSLGASGSATKPAAPSVAGIPPGGQPVARPDKPKESPGAISWVYIVRLGAFQHSENAQELHKKLQQKGYPVVVKTGQNLQKGTLYYVELKPIRDQAEAKSQASRLQREENASPLLLKVTETR